MQCCAVIAPGCPPQQLDRRSSLRKQLVERVFGIIKEQQGARKFLLHGLANVAAEWIMLSTAFNLRTLWKVWRLGVFADLLRGPKPHFAS